MLRRLAFVLLAVVLFPFPSVAQVGDYNGDSVFDCHDMELLHEGRRNGDPSFDLTDAQWRMNASSANGFTVFGHDFDMNGRVDHRDYLTVAANLYTNAGYCRGDFDGDGWIGHGDRTQFIDDYFEFHDNEKRPTGDILRIPTPATHEAWSENGVPFARTDQFDLVAYPQTAPNGLLVTRIAARMHDESHRFAAFDGPALTGSLHQLWMDGPFGAHTPMADWLEAELIPAGWGAYDSYFLITPQKVAHGFFPGQVSETNDATDPNGLTAEITAAFPDAHPLVKPKTGFGEITTMPSNISMLDLDFRASELMIAQVATPWVANGEIGEVFLTIGLQGIDPENNSLPDVGFIDSLSIPFFNAPCDFDANGICESADLDLLLAAVGEEDRAVNLDANPIVNNDDVIAWLNFASNGSVVFVPGDANLDGAVDAADLNVVGGNWLATGPLSWADGDFNGDKRVDSSDLNAIGTNWLHGISTAAAVPEPSGGWIWWTCLLALLGQNARRSGRLDF